MACSSECPRIVRAAALLSMSTIASLRKRLFVSVGSWWQLCYPNETLREHMARKVFTMFIVLILNLYQTTATEMSSPSRPGQS